MYHRCPAVGPLLFGFLVAFGFPVPFAVGAALATIGVVPVIIQVEETVAPSKADGT